MRPFGTYLKALFQSWWAGVGALSVLVFFERRLNDWAFVLAVAVLAFISAGYRNSPPLPHEECGQAQARRPVPAVELSDPSAVPLICGTGLC
jgi:hypothetical protein